MSSAVCVGGVLADGRFVRLLDSNSNNQSINTKLEVGEVYTINFEERKSVTPPHVEDILVDSFKYKFTFNSINDMVNYLIDKLEIPVWEGSCDVLFDYKILWTLGGSGYISEENVPSHSVGFWKSDRDLTRRDFNDKVRYSYPIRWRNIPFVGFQEPLDVIPMGTLIRVSLARWWSPDGEEERCYLQLSGWYI